MTFTLIIFPESPRWLIAKGKNSKALEVIREAAKMNYVSLNGDIFSKDDKLEESEEIAQYGFLDIFHSSVLKISLAMFVCWPVTTLI